MSRSNSDPHDPFIEGLSAALAQTAKSVSPSPDFAQQVRQRLRADERPRRASLSFAARLPSTRAIGSAALVALVVGALVWLLVGHGVGLPSPLGSQPGGASTAQNCDNGSKYYVSSSNATPPPDHSVALGVSATSDGVTITLDRAYADATQTVVTYHVSPDSALTPEFPVIVDSSGARYRMLLGSGIRVGDHYADLAIFAPLPQDALGSPQRLTFASSGMQSTTGGAPNATPTMQHLQGTWSIPFTITPVAGVATPLSLAAQTHAGVTIQPEEMDVAPAGGGLDGQNGGVRVRFRVSGLPASMPLYEAAAYVSNFQAGPGGAGSGIGCGGELTLGVGSSNPFIPGFILPAGQIAPTSAADINKWNTETVGASGSVEIQALFFAPVQLGSVVKLTFDHIEASTRTANGPWVFTQRLNAQPAP